jgi:predicted SprT family Zn-dependent metalloprotease
MNLDAAQKLAEELLRKHRMPGEWSFGFDRSKVRFGKCDYRRKRISLSSHLVELNDEPCVRDTVLHEIAHALAQRGAGHGAAWRSIALAIGCNGSRCYGNEVQRPKPKYRGTCHTCGRVIHRHRRSLLACGHCTPVFDSRFAFVWT